MTKARNIADIGSNDVLDTDANGVDVTGTITTDALSQSNTTGAAGITLNRNFSGDVSSYTNTPDINFTMTDTGTSDQVIVSITPQAIGGVGDAFGGNFRLNTANTSGTEVKRISVDENGDIIMYKDDGTTAGFEFDASTANVTVNGDIQLTETGDTTQSLTFQQVGGASFIKPKSGSNDGELYISGGQTATNRMKITTSGDIIFYKSNGSSVGAHFESSNGFLGLGVSSPKQLLHVNQTTASSDSIVRITNTSTPSTGGHRVEFADGIGSVEGSTVFRYGYIAGERSSGANDGHLILGTKRSSSTAPDEKVRINSSGNVSISGTPNTFDTTPSVNGLQLYYENDSGLATIGSYSSGGGTELNFHTNTGGVASTRKMRILDDGRVHIGEPTGAVSRKVTIREDAGDGSMRGMKVQNWSGNNATSGVLFQGYDWVQGGVWHGRSISNDTKKRTGALVLGTNPNTSDLSEEGLIGRLTINNAGNVTTPYQPSWAVFASSNWGWSNNANLPFNSIRWNTGGVSYNTSTYTVTIPTTGKYVVGIRGLPSTNFGQFFWQMYVNGGWRAYIFGTDGLSTYEEVRGTQIEDFNAGDTIQIRGTGNHSGFFGGYGDNSFFGYLLG